MRAGQWLRFILATADLGLAWGCSPEYALLSSGEPEPTIVGGSVASGGVSNPTAAAANEGGEETDNEGGQAP